MVTNNEKLIDLTEMDGNGQSSLPTWTLIEDITLYASDKRILEVGGWLTDKMMHAAQQLLKSKHPNISGLQSTLLQLTMTFDVHCGKEFVQCLNLSGNHWITVSSIGCGSDTVRVYDSMNLRLSPELIKTVADFLHTSNDFITIEYANMQYQSGGSDCGLFAIASACALCHLQDPAKLTFTQQQMRPHLKDAFEVKKLVPFPSKSRRVRKEKIHSENVEVHCICRLPDDGKRMVQCSFCSKWYHTKCVRAPRRILKRASSFWKCAYC